MSKPLAIGLIILFAAVIAAGIIFLAFREKPFEIPFLESTDRPSFPQGEFDSRAKDASKDETKETLPSERDLIQLTNGAVSGFYPTANGVLYVERLTGHIFEITPQGDKETKVSNTTIPQIFNVVWSPKGTGAIFSYRDAEHTRIASTEFQNLTAKGVFLAQSTVAFDYAPERERIFYLAEGRDDLVGIAADPDNTGQAEIMRVAPADFLVDWITPREIAFLTRPSGNADGFLYRYHIDRNSFDKIIGNIRGLDTKWSPDGARILFSRFITEAKQLFLSIYNVKTGITTGIDVQGFVQKCSWAKSDSIYCASPLFLPDAIYPDAWLKGQIQTNDRIVKINTKTIETSIIKTLPDIDVADIMLSPDENYLYFQNKKDGTLWSLAL